MTPATRAWERVTAYCQCGQMLMLTAEASKPKLAHDTVTCEECGQSNVVQFWHQQPAPFMTVLPNYWHREGSQPAQDVEEYARNQPAEFHKLP